MDRLSEGIVVSTRVRLARNIEGYPFPSRLKEEKKAKEIIRLVSSGISRLDEFRLYYMDNIADEKAVCLMENHLISPNLIKNKRFSAVLLNREDNVSIMINEEDHLREQCIVKGLDLKLAYDTMSEIDNRLARTVKFAYDERLGFLTACPTNLGTGLRASVMLFLPAATMNDVMPEVIEKIKELGLTVRGVYGEGSGADGFMYQISNEITLGVTEEEVLSDVEEVVQIVCKIETAERRKLLLGPDALGIQDDCMRAYGILTNCAKMSTREFVRLTAKVKLGVCLGYIDLPDISAIDDLVLKLSPSNITEAADRQLTATERDVYRAQTCAKAFEKMRKNKTTE